MSWTLSVGPISPGELRSTVEAAVAATETGERPEGVPVLSVGPELTAEVREQVECAIQAAQHLLAGIGAAGAVTVNLSGHANPGHEPDPAWSNDHISVSVNQIHTLPVA